MISRKLEKLERLVKLDRETYGAEYFREMERVNLMPCPLCISISENINDFQWYCKECDVTINEEEDGNIIVKHNSTVQQNIFDYVRKDEKEELRKALAKIWMNNIPLKTYE